MDDEGRTNRDEPGVGRDRRGGGEGFAKFSGSKGGSHAKDERIAVRGSEQ